MAELNGRAGQFRVVPAQLPGKLRTHRDDSRQFAYGDGRWLLHIGDTGYRYVTDTEPQWQAYIDQAAKVGFTKMGMDFQRREPWGTLLTNHTNLEKSSRRNDSVIPSALLRPGSSLRSG